MVPGVGKTERIVPASEPRLGLHAWWTVGVLAAASCISFIDRTLINLLVEPIKADLALSDTEIGLLQGLAFAIFYTTLGLPIGYLADRWSRKSIVLMGGSLWCLLTAASGLASSFWQLFAARVGVGAGEASLSPCAISMIGDIFPAHRRPLAIGIYQMATTMGGGLALILGGAAVSAIATSGFDALPILGTLKPWQMTFVLVGLCGFLIILLILTIEDPRRRHEDASSGVQTASVLRFIERERRFFAPFLIGCALHTAIAYAIFSWAPAIFFRRFGWEVADVGLVYGLVFLFSAGSGPIVGGWFAGICHARGIRNSSVNTSLIGIGAAAPFAALAALAPSANTALLLFAPALFFISFPGGTLLSAMQEAAPAGMRARAIAVYYLVVSVVGLSVGPLMSGVLMDRVLGGPAHVGEALAIVAMSLGPVAALLVWRSAGHRLAS